MYLCYCCLFKIRFLSYYNIPLGVSLTEAMRLANNKIKGFHVTFEHTTFYRRFVIWQRNHFTEMQMGYKVLFVMLLNAKATLVYTGHVSKQDPFDFVWSNHYKEPLRCQHILLKYSDVLQQPANGLPCEWLCRLKGNLHPHIKCTYFTGYLDSSYKLPVMGDVKHLPSLDYNGNNWYRMWCFVFFFKEKLQFHAVSTSLLNHTCQLTLQREVWQWACGHALNTDGFPLFWCVDVV